mmetsp:Transcript_35363/g.88896  ORF Transcript_35363/g.88896 Transcript_35363/m.88896 type:complete len:765 (+) Transcript_35363:169-2463(+)
MVQQHTSMYYNIGSSQNQADLADPVIKKKILIVKERGAVDWEDEDIFRVLEDALYDENVAINNILDGFAQKSGDSWSKCEKKKKKTKDVASQSAASGRGKGPGRGKSSVRGRSAPPPASEQRPPSSPASSRGGRGGAGRTSRNQPPRQQKRTENLPVKPAPQIPQGQHISLNRTYKTGDSNGPSMAEIVSGVSRQTVQVQVSTTTTDSQTTTTVSESLESLLFAPTDTGEHTKSSDRPADTQHHAEMYMSTPKPESSAPEPELAQQQQQHTENISSHDSGFIMEQAWPSSKDTALNHFAASSPAKVATPLGKSPEADNNVSLLSHQMDDSHMNEFSNAPVVLPSGLLNDDQELSLQFGNLGFGSLSSPSQPVEKPAPITQSAPAPAEPQAHMDEAPQATPKEEPKKGLAEEAPGAGQSEQVLSQNDARHAGMSEAEQHLPIPSYGYLPPSHFMPGMPYAYGEEASDILRMTQARPPMFYDHNAFHQPPGFRADAPPSSSTPASSSSSSAAPSSSSLNGSAMGKDGKFDSSSQKQPHLQPGVVPLAAQAPAPAPAPGHFVGGSQYSTPLYTYPYMHNQYPSYQAPAGPAQFPYAQRMPQYYKDFHPTLPQPSPSAYPSMHGSLGGGYPSASNVSTLAYHEEDYSKYGQPSFFIPEPSSMPKAPAHHHTASQSKQGSYSAGSAGGHQASSAQLSSGNFKSQDYKYGGGVGRDGGGGSSQPHTHYGSAAGGAAVQPPFPASGQSSGFPAPFMQPHQHHMMGVGYRNY